MSNAELKVGDIMINPDGDKALIFKVDGNIIHYICLKSENKGFFDTKEKIDKTENTMLDVIEVISANYKNQPQKKE